jgi:hypothetical protein
VSRVAEKLARKRGSEETRQERLAQAEVEVTALHDRIDSELAAVAAFSAAEPLHRRDARRGVRARLDAVHEAAAVFGMRVKALQGDVSDVAADLSARKKAFALSLSRHRNAILKMGLLLPLIGAMLASCSMISGWFGMNLANGTCGPDGCNEWNILILNAESDAADPFFLNTTHGYENFIGVTVGASCAALLAGAAAWLYIRRLL